MLDATNDKLESLKEADDVQPNDAQNKTEPLIEKESTSQEEVSDVSGENVKVLEDTSEEKAGEVAAAEKVVQAIEEEVAAAAERETEKEVVAKVNYNDLDMEALVKELESLVKNEQIQSIKSAVEAIRKTFDAKFSTLLAEKKAAFLAEGGESIDFYFSSPLKVKFNEIMAAYRKKRNTYYAELDAQLKENLDKRFEVIEKLKTLIENANSKTMHKEFKELDAVWKSIGPVPRTKYNNTWRNYHHHVERFYDLLHINNDLRELDFKHNLEEKIKIIEKAEALGKLEDVSFAFKELQKLHKLWKEDIGPVSREFREEIWQKFSAATKVIHDKRTDYNESQKLKFAENLELKRAVISELEKFDTSNCKTHSDWQKAIREFEAIREGYFKIGKVSGSKRQVVWEELKKVTKKFNHDKNRFYKDLNSEQQTNLKKKQALVALAVSLKDSDDFSSATPQMKRIQADWKLIGHVPRKYSDKIWKEFKDACNYYFDRIHKIQDEGSPEEMEALATKKEFLSQINDVVGNPDISVEEVEAYIKTWNNIGRVPRNEKGIENDFNKAIEQLFKQLSIEGDALKFLKYKMTMNAYAGSNNTRKLDSEMQFVRKKIDEFTKDIQQLENNISFIANAKEDNPLVINVRNSIKAKTEELSEWKQKRNFLKGLY